MSDSEAEQIAQDLVRRWYNDCGDGITPSYLRDLAKRIASALQEAAKADLLSVAGG